MSTTWVVILIIFVLLMIVGNILLLKKSAKFGLKKKVGETKNTDRDRAGHRDKK